MYQLVVTAVTKCSNVESTGAHSAATEGLVKHADKLVVFHTLAFKGSASEYAKTKLLCVLLLSFTSMSLSVRSNIHSIDQEIYNILICMVQCGADCCQKLFRALMSSA